MRFVLGPLPENEEFHPLETGWCKVRDPSPVLLHLLALPTAVVLLFLTFLPCRALFGRDAFNIGALDMSLVYWSVALLIPVHELMHAVSAPSFGMSDKTVVGLWYQRLFPYAVHTDAMTRGRIIWFLIMPFLMLTLLPIAAMWLLRVDSPFLFHFILVNAGGCAADFVQVPIFLSQVPRRGLIRNKGYDSYWRVQKQNQAFEATP